jgi:hypothetical protein
METTNDSGNERYKIYAVLEIHLKSNLDPLKAMETIKINILSNSDDVKVEKTNVFFQETYTETNQSKNQ